MASQGETTMISLPPPPRRVTGSPGASIWFGRVLLLPHTLVGLGSVVAVIVVVLWSLFGVVSRGDVVGGHISTRKGQTIYLLDYTYEVDGITRSDSGTVPKDTFRSLLPARHKDKTSVQVNHFQLGPLHLARLTAEGAPAKLLLPLGAWAIFWNGILASFFYMFWVQPIRRKQLYRSGRGTPGTIVHKRSQSGGKTLTFKVAYRYTSDTGASLSAEMKTSRDRWEQATIGQPVTVLYWPDNPRRSIVYELGEYRVSPSS